MGDKSQDDRAAPGTNSSGVSQNDAPVLGMMLPIF
jgi:hypothetical protein